MDRSADPRMQADVLAAERESATAADFLAQQAALVAAANSELNRVARAVMGERFGSIRTGRTEQGGRDFATLTDSQGREATLWLDSIPMPTGTVANSVANTTSNQYIVHVSDRLSSEHLTRVLAHEMGELLAVRDRSSQDLAPVRESLLERGAEIGEQPELSSQDHGRIGELNWLAERANDIGLSELQRAGARAELSAMLDHCGLRAVAPMSDVETRTAELDAAQTRRFASKDHLSTGTERLVRELARPIEQLAPADAAALQASRDAALVAQRQVEAFIGRREVTMPMPGYAENGLPYPRDALEGAAPQWADYRAQVSDHTVENLQQETTDEALPRRQVVIGGGASLAGRNPEALLVDGVGRWHLDPGAGIVQSADQDRDLQQWMGVDPYQAVSKPGERVSIDAVRLWEDQLATQGPVVNGHAQLRLGQDGLEAEVQPFDRDGNPSGAALRVACDGIPSVATGLPPEVVPGMPRGANGVESRSEAVRLISERLRELESTGLAGAEELRTRLTGADRGGQDAASLLDTLQSSPLRDALTAGLGEGPAARMENCFTILDATQRWESAREAAPGRALMGDEVAESRFNPGDAQHWIVAGSGGTGVANAEIILLKDPEAKVTIIGAAPPPALVHQVQYREMLETYQKSGRLTFIEARVGAIETFQDENGQTSFSVPYTEGEPPQRKELRGDGYVASLGRTNPLPAAVQSLANDVRDQGGEISGDLRFDRDDQYLGYGLTFRTKDGQEHRVDVDGAASWQLPREVFPPEEGLQGRLNEMGARALPAETGNAAPGFSPIARQSALKARAVAAEQAGDENAVQRRTEIPDRWKRPGPAAEAESTTGPAPSPGPAPTLAPTGPQREPAAEIPRQPAPPAPKPAPGRGAPDAHLWQMGVPQTRRSNRTAPTQPQQLPPDQQRPGPSRGPGLGD
ncbi:hypothetical protein ABZ958_11135 [Streptomyces sp. NPDC046237]|uniref:hypothetical protein n=1 Tax=Streptomyces sp. NPDC046237 TaxID=3154914 RepID=UPI0033C983F2